MADRMWTCRQAGATSFYDEYASAPADRALPAVQGEHPHPTAPFEDYSKQHDN